MKYYIYSILTLLFFTFGNVANSQNCSNIIAENKTISGTHILRTNPQTIVVRGNYTYSMELMNDDKGILGKVYSKAGVTFNLDDEVIFMDYGGNRKAYRFIEMGEMDRSGGTPVHQNVLQLDLTAVKWFAKTTISTIYIKNNISNEMRKFTVNSNRQTEFRNMANCFVSSLNTSLINDKPLVGNDLSTRSKISSTSPRPEEGTKSGDPISKTRSGNNPQSIEELDDGELARLRKELKQTKDQLRAEIQAERDKADNAKQLMAEEVSTSRQQAEEQKATYAQEVLEARKKSQIEIDKATKAVAESVVDAKEKAQTEIEKINVGVVEAKNNAAKEINKAKLEAAEKVASAREQAANELAELKKNMEMTKLEYADEISNARENSSTEIDKIRSETAQMITDAREKAKTEQNRTAEEVVETKNSASEQILKIKEETAAEISTVREKNVAEKEKLAFELAETRRKLAEERALLLEQNAAELAEIKENTANEKEAAALDVAQAKKRAAEQIGEFNNQVAQEKQKSDELIARTKQETAAEITAAKEAAAKERAQSAKEIQEAKQKAAEEITKINHEEAAAIADARDKANSEKQKIADEVAMAQKRAADEIARIQQEVKRAIEEAKAIVLTNEGKQYMDQIRKHILLFQNIERAKLEQQNADYQRNRLFITRFVTLQIPLIVTLLVFCAFYINSRLFKPLKLLIQNTEQLEKGERPKMLTINYNDEIGFVLKRFARMSDIVYKRTSKLNFQASHDHLTGVLNRTELKPALKQAISTCSKDSKLAVIFIDINKFKKLNDEYGHLIGDQILIETAKRITSSVRADDDVYRYGGDEFVIITHNIAKYRYVNAMITHLLARFDNPFVLEQLTLNISLSIGVALAPDHSLNHQHLLKLADQAMYHAKHESKNSYHIHNNRG